MKTSGPGVQIWGVDLHRAHVLRALFFELGSHASSLPALASVVPTISKAVKAALIRLTDDTHTHSFCDFPTTDSFVQLTKSPEVVFITLLSRLWGENMTCGMH